MDKAPEDLQAEAQRLREEQERREELERSTRAAAESMAAQKLQRERMDAIMRVQALGLTVSDTRGVDAALEAARAFDPSTFGEMEPMALNAKALAVTTLEQRLARVLELELPGAIEEAYALDAMVNAAHAESKLVPVHEIDWDEPAPLAPYGMPVAQITTIKTPLAQCDAAVVRAFRNIVRELRKTRPSDEIRKLLDDELAVLPGQAQKNN